MNSTSLTPVEQKTPEVRVVIAANDGLVFLTNIDPKKLEEYGKPYGITSAEKIDEIVGRRRVRYYYYYIKHAIAESSWFFNMAFQAEESGAGIQATSELVNVHLSSKAINDTGAVTGVAGSLPFTMFFPLQKIAVERVLKYETQPPFSVRCKNAWNYAKKYPKKAAFDLIVDASGIISNMNAAMLPPLGLAALFGIESPIKKAILAAFLCWPSYVFFDVFFDLEKGKKYFHTSDDPSLLQHLRDLEFETAFHIFMQLWVCSAGIRAFPFYYFIAQKCLDYVGVWFPAELVMACAFIQTIVSMSETINKRYVKSRKELDRQLRAEYFAPLGALVSKKPYGEQKLEHAILNGLVQRELTEFSKQQCIFYELKAEPSMGVFFAVWAALGAYFGELAGPTIYDSTTVTVLTSLVCASILGALSWKGDSQRVTDRLCLEFLKPQPEQKEMAERKKSVCEKFTVQGLGTLFVIASSLLTVTSTLGTLETSSKELTVIIALLSFVRGVASGVYNSAIKDNMSTWFASRRKVETESKKQEEKSGHRFLCWRR